jgi:Na+-driven multidrug efflux pump
VFLLFLRKIFCLEPEFNAFPFTLLTIVFLLIKSVGAIAAKLGEEEVAVFNTSYRIMWIVLIMVIAMSGASGINMSIRLGRLDHVGAKQAGYVGVSLAGLVCLVISLAVVTHVRYFGMIFTNDQVFLDLFEETRWPFTCCLFLMNLSIAIEKIPYSMGRTTEVFWYGLIASWGGMYKENLKFSGAPFLMELILLNVCFLSCQPKCRPSFCALGTTGMT